MKNRTPLLLILAIECLLLSALAHAGDPLIWEDQFDLGGKFDRAEGIAVSGRQAVVIGIGETATGEVAMLLRAYESATGMLEWQDQTPIAFGFITNVVIAGFGDEVFGAGYLAHDEGTDFLVRAYDAKTGKRLWEDIADKGRDDFVLGIAASQAGVFAVGNGGNMGGSPLDVLVRAYDRTTGTVLWEDQVDYGGTDDAAGGVATEGEMVFVAVTSRGATTRDFALRAYDATTGKLAWESRYPAASGGALATDPHNVYVGGHVADSSGLDHPFLASFDSTTGDLVWWQDRPEAIGDVIAEVVVRGSRLFSCGQSKTLVSSYDARTGRLIWEDRTGSPEGTFDAAFAIDVGPDLVFMAGQSGKPFIYSEFWVRAYDPKSGKLVWEDRAHRSTDVVGSGAFDIAVKGDRVLAAGFSSEQNPDFLVRAYSAHELKPLSSNPAH